MITLPVDGPSLRVIRTQVGLSTSAMARLLGVDRRDVELFEGLPAINPPAGHRGRVLVAVYEALGGVFERGEEYRRAGMPAAVREPDDDLPPNEDE